MHIEGYLNINRIYINIYGSEEKADGGRIGWSRDYIAILISV